MPRASIVHLEFDPELNCLSKKKKLTDGLSCVVQIKKTLWVANDESLSLERLTLGKQGHLKEPIAAKDHKQFFLAEYLHLPGQPNGGSDELPEVDLEGLAYEDGYLWLVGSHSLKRKKVKLKDGADKKEQVREVHDQLAKVSEDGNRYLLARIPVVSHDGTYRLELNDTSGDKKRTAAILHGDDKENDLTQELKTDRHLQRFLKIPSKDNGFDIEGLAVVGDRLFIGLRGPVLRGWAMILEVEPQEENDRADTLKLKPIGPDGRPYRKHFLQLDGLGIRDLCVDDKDLLILAGPTMELDEPVIVYRWLGGANPKGEAVVPIGDLKQVLQIDSGKREDHAEGMTLFSHDGRDAHSLLVVYDSMSKDRQLDKRTAVADVFLLSQGLGTSRVATTTGTGGSAWLGALGETVQQGFQWIRSHLTRTNR